MVEPGLVALPRGGRARPLEVNKERLRQDDMVDGSPELVGAEPGDVLAGEARVVVHRCKAELVEEG
eukprot:6564058-Lingulodinium_polyedra.AAC.1